MSDADSTTPSSSFIGIVDFTPGAKFVYVSESVVQVLGWEPKELVGASGMALVHPDEILRVRKLHTSTIKADGAATVVYNRLKHKDPNRGYILCLVTRTIVHDVLVSSISYASHSLAMRVAATAQQVDVITPEGSRYSRVGRWARPPPRKTPSPPSSTTPSSSNPSGSTSTRSDSPSHSIEIQRELSFAHDTLPNQSQRTLFILDRYTPKATILYCSNDLLISSTEVATRSFYDFVYEKDEEVVRTWITQVKSWGINDLGQPTDSGFGYAWFTFLTESRDSSARRRIPEPNPAISSGRSRRAKDGKKWDPHQFRPSSSLARSDASSFKPYNPQALVQVDAIFSAHSDGVMIVLRKRDLPEEEDVNAQLP